jgi:hypothetical protein
MLSLSDLDKSVKSILAGQRLGRPVFVRVTWQGEDPLNAMLGRLSQLTALVGSWFGAALTWVYANGNLETGQVTLTLKFTSGAVGIVSFIRGRPRGSGLDLFVIGNHGTASFDAGSDLLWDEPAGPTQGEPHPLIQLTIQRALASGKPEPAGTRLEP